ncbi:hypothetical protein BY996DRAFT_6415782 [Phakopsora pachyrhizi]|nr:hypothetical protein BY996DRAFT_6415782 [Phakopsora pachyrhizi]
MLTLAMKEDFSTRKISSARVKLSLPNTFTSKPKRQFFVGLGLLSIFPSVVQGKVCLTSLQISNLMRNKNQTLEQFNIATNNNFIACPDSVSNWELVFMILGALLAGFLIFMLLIAVSMKIFTKILNIDNKEENKNAANTEDDQERGKRRNDEEISLDCAPYLYQHHTRSIINSIDYNQNDLSNENIILPSYESAISNSNK